jgi:hypothetical protein
VIPTIVCFVACVRVQAEGYVLIDFSFDGIRCDAPGYQARPAAHVWWQGLLAEPSVHDFLIVSPAVVGMLVPVLRVSCCCCCVPNCSQTIVRPLSSSSSLVLRDATRDRCIFTCPGGIQWVWSLEECNAAARELSLGDTSATEILAGDYENSERCCYRRCCCCC